MLTDLGSRDPEFVKIVKEIRENLIRISGRLQLFYLVLTALKY